MRLFLTAILFFSILPRGYGQFQGLVVNEFSQGDRGVREYIELLVMGRRTCTDSTADLRGWIVDDQNGWYGNGSLTKGHYRFANVANWAAVPIGSIVLLYNSASGEKNLSIALPDDPTDADRDLVYVVPINSNAYLEENDNEPSSLTGPNYVYPPPGSVVGYNGTSNLWIQHIALTNGNDVICTVSPQDRTTHYFSIGNGYSILPPFRAPTVSVPGVNAGFSCYLTDGNYTAAGSWAVAPVPTKETPGLPNGGANTAWIVAMRTTPRAVRTFVTACSNGPYFFNGQTFTTTGSYSVLTNNNNGCVDTASVYVVISRLETKDTAGCDSLFFNGRFYTTNATVRETVPSRVLTCDSIVRTVNLAVNKSKTSFVTACPGPGQTFSFNGQTLSTTGTYTARLATVDGCDSVVQLYLVKTRLDTVTISGCDSVVYRGQTFTASTLQYDTVKSAVARCDSVVRVTQIRVNRSQTTRLQACAPPGGSYVFFGQTLTASGRYAQVLKTASGCDSTVQLQLQVAQRENRDYVGCLRFVYNGIVYTSSTTLTDTLRSVLTGCDSVLRTVRIQISNGVQTDITACIRQGQAYPFNGQLLTVAGSYVATYRTPTGCDSTVRLYLGVSQLQQQTLSGCNAVAYNGTLYTASTTLADTVRSVVTACDSLVRVTAIRVYQQPVLTVDNDTAICRYDTVTLTASSPGAAVAWTGFGPGNAVLVSPQNTTRYYVSATDSNGCVSTDSVTVAVQDFLLTLTAGNNPVLAGSPVWLQTGGNRSYTVLAWQPLALFARQSAKSQTAHFDSSATVRVVGRSATGCRDTASLEMAVIPLDDLYIPTAFTPNGDGRNDAFHVAGSGIRSLEMTVYNRWGQAVFFTSEKDKGWNGRFAGWPQPAGVYVYVLRATKTSGRIAERKGTVTLIR